MTARARMVLGLMVVLVAVGGAVAAKDVTLTGSFTWEREGEDNPTGDLTAVFTPTGDSEWDVSFSFDWEDGPHVYTGTASGSLSEGELKGAVESDGERNMSFRFTGSFEDGSFSGTHAFVSKEGETQHSGTMALGR